MKDIVFIDTSIFISEHYFKKNNRLNLLAQLHDAGLIDFISTEITISEIQKHFVNDIQKLYSSIVNSSNEISEKGIDLSLNIDSKFDIQQLGINALKRFLQRTETYVIQYSEITSVEPVFNKYFQQDPPFGGGKKKNEFPDAFALYMLEEYCNHKKLPRIIVLSNDKDMHEYESTHIEYKDYKQYVTEKSAEKEILSNIAQLLQREKDENLATIKEDLEEVLYDEGIYYNVLMSTDINDIEIDAIDLDLDTDNFSIINQTDDYYIIEVPIRISFIVDIEYIDYTYATYDREDDQWYNEELSHYKAHNDKSLTLLFTYHKTNNGQQPYIVMEDYDIEDALFGME